MPMQSFRIRGPYIALGQLLKSVGIVGGGGEVKDYLLNNEVLVNGERDDRRGRKLYPGDSVRITGREEITLTAEVE